MADFPRVTAEPHEYGLLWRHSGQEGEPIVDVDRTLHGLLADAHHRVSCVCHDTYHVPCHSLACSSGDRQVIELTR